MPFAAAARPVSNGRDQFGLDFAFAQPLISIQTLPRGVPGHTIHPPRSDRASAMVRRHLSCGCRDEGEGRNRITRRGRTAGSRLDRQLAEKALYAKTKFKLTPRCVSIFAAERQGVGQIGNGYPVGHRLGLASLMAGTLPPLPFQLPPLSSSRAKQPG
jgi:hypothetical protein